MIVWFVSGILIVVLILLLTERLPIGVTAIGIMAVLAVSGVLTPAEAIQGLANPAVVTVAAMLLISRGMMRTGAMGMISDRVMAIAGDRGWVAMALVVFTAGVGSAFINNTPVVVLFIPVIMGMCCRYDRNPSTYLIPLSYVSILAGTCTLIGTSTNIIISDLSGQYGYGTFGMFELASVGLPVAIFGSLFVWVAASRLLPKNPNPACELDSGKKKYLAEVLIPKESRLVGQDARLESFTGVTVIEAVRNQHVLYPNRDTITIQADDRLLVKGVADDLVAMIQTTGAVLPHAGGATRTTIGDDRFVTVEIVIPPQSHMVGARIARTELMRDPDVSILAVERTGHHYSERKIETIQLKTGDVLLVHLPWERLDSIRSRSDLIVVEDIHHRMVHRHKARRAVFIFAGMVLAASTGMMDIMTAALTASAIMLVTGCLSIRDAYRSMQGDVLLLIAGTIALGTAMETTGTSRIFAEAYLSLFAGVDPIWALAGMLVLTSISTQLLSNNATAVLLLPIAISTAMQLGVHPKPFIMAVCFGASACFATPIGYQTNLLVFSPGGYRFADYLKLGVPLNLLVIVLTTVLIPRVWPF